jgi:hypothetical protein
LCTASNRVVLHEARLASVDSDSIGAVFLSAATAPF